MDQADFASEREGEYLAVRLAEQQRSANLDAPGADLCGDCEEPIPAARRAAMPSAYRCVACQAWAERVAKIPNTA